MWPSRLGTPYFMAPEASRSCFHLLHDTWARMHDILCQLVIIYSQEALIVYISFNIDRLWKTKALTFGRTHGPCGPPSSNAVQGSMVGGKKDFCAMLMRSFGALKTQSLVQMTDCCLKMFISVMFLVCTHWSKSNTNQYWGIHGRMRNSIFHQAGTEPAALKFSCSRPCLGFSVFSSVFFGPLFGWPVRREFGNSEHLARLDKFEMTYC